MAAFAFAYLVSLPCVVKEQARGLLAAAVQSLAVEGSDPYLSSFG